MTEHEPGHPTSLKERALEELKTFWLIALYLWVFLGAFMTYRVLILAETGVWYVHLGVAFVEALIVAKVVLLGNMLSFTRRYDDRALYVSVAYKSALFGVLVVIFAIVEHLVEGLVKGKGLEGGLRDMFSVGGYELAARVLMLVVAFVPFFAFWELGRVLGMQKLANIFFSPRGAAPGSDDPGRAPAA